jgi:hypothetical protein
VKISVYRESNSPAQLDQLPMTRDWMDLTFDRHAYQCFPVSMANRTGLGISFTEDVSFIWDGVNTSSDHHIKILKGEQFAHSKRGNRTVSFETGLYISPEINLSIMTMPPPNIFLDGVQCISTVISTSALVGSLPIALMVTKPNEEILIPAGTIVASILPISLSELNNTEIVIKDGRPDFMYDPEWNTRMRERGDASQKLNSSGEWTHFYRNAVDHNGDSYGQHEAKKIIIKVADEN